MTRRDWFNTMKPEIAAKAIANSTEVALNTPKASLYDSLCDEDGFDFDKTPEGSAFWLDITDEVWEKQETASQNN